MSTTTQPQTGMPTPEAILDAAAGFQRTYALKTAVDLDLFTAVAEGNETAAAIATARNVSERGARILCDYLVTLGFLSKDGGRYALSPDSTAFLNRHSPAYLGSALDFLTSSQVLDAAATMAQAVRTGSTPAERAFTKKEHELWPIFARAMAPLQALPARLAAEYAGLDPVAESKVLDVAAGHGEFGFAVARRFPRARIVALDAPDVLAVARERAFEAGLEHRFAILPGDAFTVDLGSEYDLVLVPNFLHHFGEEHNVAFLRRVASALRMGGKIIVCEFVPNDDRVSPPAAARFALTMLTGTPQGDAYTFTDLSRMLTAAGFTGVQRHPLLPTPQTALVAQR